VSKEKIDLVRMEINVFLTGVENASETTEDSSDSEYGGFGCGLCRGAR
jgi:hypothetical protein